MFGRRKYKKKEYEVNPEYMNAPDGTPEEVLPWPGGNAWEEMFEEMHVNGVQCSNDGFATSKFVTLDIYGKGRFFVLRNFVDMEGNEFKDSNRKNMVFDLQRNYSKMQLIRNRGGYEDAVIVIGEWWFYGNTVVDNYGNTLMHFVIPIFKHMDELLAKKKKEEQPEIPVYAEDYQVEKNSHPVRNGVYKKNVAAMAHRNDTAFSRGIYRLKVALNNFMRVARVIGIVCNVAAVLYTILGFMDIIRPVFDVQVDGALGVICAVVCVLTMGTLIFSGGLLGCFRIIGGALSLTSGTGEDALDAGTDALYWHSEGVDSFVIGDIVMLAFNIALFLIPLIISICLIVYFPIVPVIVYHVSKEEVY